MANTNIIKATINFFKLQSSELQTYFKYSNRINNVGEALEYYIKDLFCDSTIEKDINKKEEIYGKYFSYLGNQNNPPDFMINGGDAFEVKKIENNNSTIALNSSYPKDKLYCNSPLINNACKTCENWIEKDMFYILGTINERKIKNLWIVQGSCYCADKEVYERIKNKITEGLNEVADIELSTTNEIGRINKVDPLGISYLRVRGMWGILHPYHVFDYLDVRKDKDNFNLNILMLEHKYKSYSRNDLSLLENLRKNGLIIKQVKIKSPNNPAIYLSAVLITYSKKET